MTGEVEVDDILAGGVTTAAEDDTAREDCANTAED
jgi:hypothetical protein